MEYFSSYEVTYTVCDIWSGDCESPVSQTITDFTMTQFTVTDLSLWANYIFTVSVQSMENEFTHILPTPMVTRTITIMGLLAPEITSVSELANITSVQVTWNQPEGGLAADEYVVSYHRLNGRDGQCSSFQDEDSVTVRAEGVRRHYTATFHLLQVNTVYLCTVTARRNDGTFQNTTSHNFTTNSTVPSGAPQNISTSSSNCINTGVTILSWDSVECIHRNGLITHYIISYGQGGDGETNQMNVRVNLTNQDEGGSYSVTGIDPTANYVFKVAAVNEDGVGVFANVSFQENDGGTLPSGSQSGTSTTTIAGLTTVIVIQFVALVICGVVITILAYKMRMSSKEGGGDTSVKKGDKEDDGAAIYEEPDMLTPTKLEACPAYELTKID